MNTNTGNDRTPDHSPPPRGVSGGCAMVGAGLFVLAAVVWPLFFLAGHGNPEPEALMIPLLVGGPGFLAAHIFGAIALRSGNRQTAGRGTWALRVVWGSIVILILLGVVSWLRNPESWTAAREPENSQSE